MLQWYWPQAGLKCMKQTTAMLARRTVCFNICMICISLAHAQQLEEQPIGLDTVKSSIGVADVEGRARRLTQPAPRRFKIAPVSYEPPPPTLRVVFFTPADLEPPRGLQHRMNQIAEATERFLVNGMKHWKYAPANEQIFRRDGRGSVEVLRVKGKYPAASGRYQKPNFAADVIAEATRRHHIVGRNHVWWIFTYLGDPPERIDEYRGSGDTHAGGWAIVNYSTLAGEIRPDLGIAAGFNAEFTLKGCIHELGHALGLPHIGPNPALGLGNSLMGPNNDVYAQRKLPNPEGVYLTAAAAAMLWKHPIFSGTAQDRGLRPAAVRARYRARYNPQKNRVTIDGTLTSDLRAHSVVVLDDRGDPADEYWYRGSVARLATDRSFHVEVDDPPKADGHYRIVFCFDNGAIAGDGKQPAYFGAIITSYRFRDGQYRFGE